MRICLRPLSIELQSLCKGARYRRSPKTLHPVQQFSFKPIPALLPKLLVREFLCRGQSVELLVDCRRGGPVVFGSDAKEAGLSSPEAGRACSIPRQMVNERTHA